MRKAIGLGLMLPAMALAQSLGTKTDIKTQDSNVGQPIVQPMDMIQMIAAVVIVGLLIKWVLPKIVGKFGKRMSTPLGSIIEVQESIPFGAGQLQIIQVRNKSLLLCVTATGANLIADLTETESKDHCANPPEAFFDMLDRASEKEDLAIADSDENESDSGLSMADAIALIEQAKTRINKNTQDSDPLDRLNRLTGGQ